MEFTQLSLGDGKNTEAETSFPMKRKWSTEAATTPSVDLQMKHPLPSDWEQCLDLQVTGKMYYVNRKTGRKRWTRPEEQKLDLELNISAGGHKDMMMTTGWEDSSSSSMGNNMVALPCSNCHLLVILSRSSPSCPNCKYVHALGSSSSSSPSIPKVPHASIGPSNWRL